MIARLPRSAFVWFEGMFSVVFLWCFGDVSVTENYGILGYGRSQRKQTSEWARYFQEFNFSKKKFYSKFFLYEESYNILFGYCCCFNFHRFFPPVLFIILGTFYNFCLYNYFCFFRCIFLINFNVILNVFTVIVFFCWFLCPSTSEWKMNKQEKQIDQMKHLINWRKWRDKFFYNYSYSLIFSSTFKMLVPCDQIKKNQSWRKWWFEAIKESELHNLGNWIFFNWSHVISHQVFKDFLFTLFCICLVSLSTSFFH
jgi:hypothetical protein